MGIRLAGFDYSRPLFYMVTLKCLKGLPALSEIVAPGKCQPNAITFALVRCIRTFHQGCQAIYPIECFSVMPDHIHLLIRLKKQESAPLRLETIVSLLMQALEGCYTDVAQRREPLFETRWHDWIIAAKGQLAAFTRYIRDNPKRHWLRHINRPYFSRVNALTFMGRTWYAYGNTAILELPEIIPFRCSRTWNKSDPLWEEALTKANRISSGGAGIGTFMSPCEKACGNAIYQAGGSLIILSPEGFPERWHPSAAKEALCAQGRLLFLSLWEPSTLRPDKAMLYQRCHGPGDLLLNATHHGGLLTP